MLWMAVLLAAAEAPVALPPLNLSGDTVPVPWTPDRRRGPGPRPTRTVFLNFDGQLLNCEGDYAPLNNARLACAPQELTNIPPFDPSGFSCGSAASCKETIRARLAQKWAEWNVRFVTERPEEGPYEMAMIGGSGNGVGEGVLGIAPLDCLDSNDNSVSFSFSADIAGLPCADDILVTTVSHEIGHALGLCHNAETSSVMYPSVNGCEQLWTCGAMVDGCGCGDSALCPTDYLDEILGPSGPDTAEPVVVIVSPLSGVTVPSDFTLHAVVRDDRTLATAQVYLNASLEDDAEPDATGEYLWDLSSSSSGPVRLCVVGIDAEGNAGQDCVNVVVDPGADCVGGDCCCGESCCEADADCGCAGRLPNGEECSLDQDCRGDLCEDDPWDGKPARVCTEGCAEDAECPSGMACVSVPGADRKQCWSYVKDGLGQPCRSEADCEGEDLSCVFPDGCTKLPIDERVEGIECVGDGFCSRPCGAGSGCPERFTCSDVGDARYCRFVGTRTEVSGACAVHPGGRPTPGLGTLGLVGLALLLVRRAVRKRRRNARKVA